MADAIQYLVVGLVVMAAVVFIGRRVWRLLCGKGSGRCGGCSACSSPIVTLGPPEPRRIDAETNVVFRGAKGDNATVVDSPVLSRNSSDERRA